MVPLCVCALWLQNAKGISKKKITRSQPVMALAHLKLKETEIRLGKDKLDIWGESDIMARIAWFKEIRLCGQHRGKSMRK